MKNLFLLLLLFSCKAELISDFTFQDYCLKELNFARTKPSEYAEIRLSGESYDYFKSLSPTTALSLNSTLNLSATDYAVLLSNKGILSHDLSGKPNDRVKAFGYEYDVTENIAGASPDRFNAVLNPEQSAIEFVKALIIDEGNPFLHHRKAILNPDFKVVGIGFARNPSTLYVNYTVQHFSN
jgi:uncharacterized protein YkwD